MRSSLRSHDRALANSISILKLSDYFGGLLFQHHKLCERLKLHLCVSTLQELRMVLQEHEWNVEDALHVLQMFSDSGGSGFLR